MNILFLNTSESFGGAAIAAKRLMKALNKAQIDATLLVRDQTSHDKNVISIHKKRRALINFIRERLTIFKTNSFKRKNLFSVSIANTGFDITQLPEFAKADIIHLHWINQGFLSMKSLDKIIDSGKPIVWTLHDMWPITGICHHARTCEKFMQECNKCPFLTTSVRKDLSYTTFHIKKNIYKKAHITFVGCSLWLTDLAKHSALTSQKEILSIPNPLDIDLYKPLNKKQVREKLNLPTDKKLILFGAVKSTDARKGFKYFITACQLLKRSLDSENIAIVLYGKDSEKLAQKIEFPTYSMGYVNQEQMLIDLYNAVDIYATPSLEENLPNAIIECMSCGTPSIGFNIGGIPEIIDHLENGYVANYKSTKDFSKGLKWLLESDYTKLSEKARLKAIKSYSEKGIAQQYIALYNKIINSSKNV